MFRRTFLAALGATTLAVPFRAFAETGAYDLVTVDEAAARTERPATRNLVALKSAGPEVVVHKPSGFSLSSPVDFDVEFRPRGAVEPDMRSLRIDYDMGLFWQDVTKRLVGHAVITGTRLTSLGARLPAGKHVLRLRIMDKERRQTVSMLEITVAGK